MRQPTSELSSLPLFDRQTRRTRRLRIVAYLCLSLAVWAARPSVVSADERDAVAPELPILLMSTRSFNQQAANEYTKHLSEQLEIGKSIAKQMDRSLEMTGRTEIEDPISGGMLFLGRGFIPIPQWVSFSEVKDQDEFRRLVQKRKSVFGDSAELETLGDGDRYKLTQTWSFMQPVPESPDVQWSEDGETTTTVVVGTTQGVTVLDDEDGEIIEQNGQRMRQISNSFTQYFRYQDGLMYESQSEGMFDIVLPTRQMAGLDTDHPDDFTLDFHPDRVPKGFKDLFWNTVQSTAAPQLQQFDDEPDRTYAVRRSGGDIGLAAIKSVIYDIDHGDIHLQLIRDNQPIQAAMHLRARKKSLLAAELPPLTQFRSRFAALRNDGAAVTIHSGVQLPENVTEALAALSEVAREEWRDVFGGEHASILADSLKLIAESGSLEVFLKLNHTDESDGVIYGGVQIQDNPKLLEMLEKILIENNQELASMVRQRDLDGRRFLQFSIPEYAEFRDGSVANLRLTDLWVCQGADCLWFAIGSENAYRMLNRSISRVESESGLRVTPPLFTGELDVARWLDYPADDPTGLGGLPRWFDENAGSLMPFGPVGPSAGDMKPTPLIDRVMALGGDARMLITIRADQQGIFFDAQVGAAIARYYVARMMDAVDGFARLQEAQLEEANSAAEEAAAPTADEAGN